MVFNLIIPGNGMEPRMVNKLEMQTVPYFLGLDPSKPKHTKHTEEFLQTIEYRFKASGFLAKCLC